MIGRSTRGERTHLVRRFRNADRSFTLCDRRFVFSTHVGRPFLAATAPKPNLTPTGPTPPTRSLNVLQPRQRRRAAIPGRHRPRQAQLHPNWADDVKVVSQRSS